MNLKQAWFNLIIDFLLNFSIQIKMGQIKARILISQYVYFISLLLNIRSIEKLNI